MHVTLDIRMAQGSVKDKYKFYSHVFLLIANCLEGSAGQKQFYYEKFVYRTDAGY